MINLEMMKRKKKIQWPTADGIICLNLVLCEICSIVIQMLFLNKITGHHGYYFKSITCDTLQTTHIIPMIPVLLLICKEKVDAATCLCK